MRKFVPLILFLGLLGAFAYGLFRDDPTVLESALINKPVPEFSLPDLYQPDVIHSEGIFKGEVSLLNIFGSWCVACVQEHPTLMNLQRRNAVRIIGVDWRDTRDAAQKWLKKYGDPYSAVIFDEGSLLAIDLGVTGAPETYVVDKTGRIRHKHVGIVSQDVWTKEIAPIVRALQNEDAS